MKRRDLVTLVGGAAVAWPSIVFAQQVSGMRRVGVLFQTTATDRNGQQELTDFENALATLGWVRDRNMHLEVRWAAGNRELARKFAKELVDLRLDVIAAVTSSMAAAVLRETKTIPVVFDGTTDPVGLGFVKSFAHPGGNATGFAQLQLTFAGKWLQVLKEIAPNVTRVLALFSPDPGSGARKTLPVLQSAAHALNTPLIVRSPGNAAEMLAAIADFAREPGGGLVQAPDTVLQPFLNQEIAAAARYRLPAVYGTSEYVAGGALMFYGVDVVAQMPQVATYVDRILRGAKPADLPVQSPTKFQLIINLKTAKALGLKVPETLLLRADQVIE